MCLPFISKETSKLGYLSGVAMHQSIIRGNPPLKRCTTCCRKFHCPICPITMFKPSQPARLQKHLEIHRKNAITFEDKKICRCNLNCRIGGHYHCPVCDNTIFRRTDMEAHLTSCPIQQMSTSATAKSKQSQDSSLPSQQPVSSAASIPLPPPTTKSPSEELQRKHHKKVKDVTETDHLKCVCVDAKNGISAVQNGGPGFSVPIHVQKKTWGQVHRIQCELEECNQYSKMASRSGLILTQCEHISSLQYCTDIATEECLREEVLTEMVHLKIFGDPKKIICLKRQKYAQAAHVPLCVEVSFEESSKYFCFSVHEPTLRYYSRLGRIFVTFNSSSNAWHCPCAKPRMSCAHTNISKWHMFQTNRDAFRTGEIDTPKKHEATVCPPSAEVYKQVVEHIYRQKSLPAE